MTQELEFHLSVTPVGGNEYLVRTERVATGVPLAEEQLNWPVEDWVAISRQLMNDPLLGLIHLSGKHPRHPENSSQAAFSSNLVSLGQQLYNNLFQGTLRDSWMTAQGIAQHRGDKLRLRLGLKGNMLPSLPWEVLHAEERPIATGTDVLFSRYQPPSAGLLMPVLDQAKATLPSNLRILMVLAGPTDQASLELKREAEHLKEELQNRSLPGSNAPTTQLTILEQPDRASLTQALEQNQYQVFHFAGHSNLGVAGGELYLVSRKTGLTETLNGYDLAGLLANNGIQLAVFNSCRGAATASYGDTSGAGLGNLAEALVKRGIPAVLAMAERIPDDVALTLARLFYRNLSAGFAVDLSLSRARQGLISAYGSKQLYWALPILYLHPEFNGYLISSPHSSSPISTKAEMLTRPASRLPRSPGVNDADDRSDFDDNYLEEIWGEVIYDDPDLDPPANEMAEDVTDDVADWVAGLLSQPPTPASSSGEPASNQQLLSDDDFDAEDLPGYLPEDNYAVSRESNFTNTPTQTPAPISPSVTPTAEKPKGPGTSGRKRKLWLPGLMAGVLGVGAVAVVGFWALRDRFVAPQEPVQTMSVPASANLNSIDLKKASTSQVAAYAIERLVQEDLQAGTSAVEALLDRGALPQAKAALDGVPKSKQDEPVVNFLYGRLIWQFVQAGNKDYSVDDARRRWEAAVKGNVKSSEYYNALGFAYYAEGNWNRASQMWRSVLKLEEGKPPAAVGKTGVREDLTAYAGSALVMAKLAKNLPVNRQGELLGKAIKTRNFVLAEDAVNFQPNALGKSWIWSEGAIRDWQGLLKLKQEG